MHSSIPGNWFNWNIVSVFFRNIHLLNALEIFLCKMLWKYFLERAVLSECSLKKLKVSKTNWCIFYYTCKLSVKLCEFRLFSINKWLWQSWKCSLTTPDTVVIEKTFQIHFLLCKRNVSKITCLVNFYIYMW